MKCTEWVSKAENHYSEFSERMDIRYSSDIFRDGAFWMHCRMNEMDSVRNSEFPNEENFTCYGIFKYLTVSAAGLVSAGILIRISLFLLPVSILIFYLTEMFFLFLFPLLIDRCRNPAAENFAILKKTGLIRSFYCLLRIAFKMISGIFNTADPFKEWKIGCIAVLFWYKEVSSSRK